MVSGRESKFRKNLFINHLTYNTIFKTLCQIFKFYLLKNANKKVLTTAIYIVYIIKSNLPFVKFF